MTLFDLIGLTSALEAAGSVMRALAPLLGFGLAYSTGFVLAIVAANAIENARQRRRPKDAIDT